MPLGTGVGIRLTTFCVGLPRVVGRLTTNHTDASAQPEIRLQSRQWEHFNTTSKRWLLTLVVNHSDPAAQNRERCGEPSLQSFDAGYTSVPNGSESMSVEVPAI